MLITGLFPSEISAVLLNSKEDGLVSLSLHEKELATADKIRHPKRKELFLLGRQAAQSLLTDSTYLNSGFALKNTRQSLEIGRGTAGEPVWPVGVVGSISHTPGYAAAAIGPAKIYSGIGIDVEDSSRPINPELGKRICSEAERQNLRPEMTLKIFSAKEAFYKAIYPICKRYLGFRDVELTWNGSEFAGKILSPLNEAELLIVNGRVILEQNLILSAAYVINGRKLLAD